MEQEAGDFSDLIQKILSYKAKDGLHYIDKFNKNWLLNHIEEREAIQLIEDEFKNFDSKGLDAVDFAKAFLSIISHTEDETLYLVVSIIDLFKDICETFDLKGTVKGSDVLNYIVESFGNREWKTHVISTRKLPPKKRFDADNAKIRDIDLEAPIVYGNHNGGIMRLINSKIITDSVPHTRSIKRACLALEIKKVFTLDSLAGSISVYNLNCGLEKKISPKLVNQKSEIMVLDFAWSDKQQRIGATLKDFSLSFWDATDNFDFEKSVQIAKWIPDYQCNIWYIEFLNLWVTTDKTFQLNAWDIEKETKTFSLSSPKVKSNIIDIIPIEILKLVAVSSMDKIITIWDFRRKTIVIELDLSQGGIHSMVWSNNYQVLVTAGYENNINLWSINPVFLDITLVGKLTGHNAMVTAIEIVEKTPMAISADDSGKLKVWDLRTLNCVQTLELGPKAYISKIINMYMFDKLCFIGSRVNFLQFDRPPDGATTRKGDDEIWPLRVEFNHAQNEIVICTRKDVRFVDVNVGKMKKLYQGLLSNEEDDITAFRLVQQDKKFILGDYRGHLGLYSYATGEKLKSFGSHGNEVTGLKVDFANKLIVSSGWDSNVIIQKEAKNGSETKRTIKNLHFNKEISIMEISVYHNLLVTAPNSNVVYVWDYEYMKLIAMIECDEGTEPTYVTFINGYSYMILADSSGKVYFLHFYKKDVSTVTFRKVATLSVTNELENFGMVSQRDSSQCFVNKILIDKINGAEAEKEETLKMFISTNKGDIRIYNISELLKLDFVKLVPHANTSMNYNSDRINHEDFLTQIQSYKTYSFPLGGKRAPLSQATSPKERDIECISLGKYLIGEFKAHKDSLTTLTTMGTPDTKLLTSSLDGYVKIWTLDGQLVGSLDINHPLPICWNLRIDDFPKNKKKVLFALKLIDRIFKRYEKKMLLSEQKNISVNRFLKSFMASTIGDFDAEADGEKLVLKPDTCAVEPRKKVKVRLMREEYTPRDLQYDKAKIIYKKELQGPSLRQMDVSQRLAEAQKAWKSEKMNETGLSKHDDELQKLREVDDRKEKNDFMSFLLGDGKRAMLSEINYSKKTRTLAKRLETISSGAPGAGAQKKKTELIRKDSASSKRGSFFMTSANEAFHKKRANNTPSPNERLSVSIEPVSPTMSKGTSKREESRQLKKGEVGPIRDPLKKSTFKLQKMDSRVDMIKPVKNNHKPVPKDIDFLEYANAKLSARSEDKQISQRVLLSPQGMKSEEYMRKVRRQNFNSVMHSMDKSLRKYQLNTPSVKNLQLSNIEKKRLISDDRVCRTQATPDKELASVERYHLRLGSEPDMSDTTKEQIYSPRQMTLGRIKSLDGAGKKSFNNFGDELLSMREHMEDNWSLNLPKVDRINKYLEEIVKGQKLKEGQGTIGENAYGFGKSKLKIEPTLKVEVSGVTTPLSMDLKVTPSDLTLPEMMVPKTKSPKMSSVRSWNAKVKDREPGGKYL